MDKDVCTTENDRYWFDRLQEWKASGLGLGGWCRENGQSFYKVRYYKRKFERKSATPDRTFTEVEEDKPSGGKLVVHIGEVRIEVEKGFDPLLLRDVMQILGGAMC